MFRTKRFVRFLYLSTGLVGLVVMSFGGGLAASSLTPAETGQFVFQTFFVTALGLLCLVAPAYASTSLTGEKEAGTYESLILTGMDPARLVWGKFLASYAVFGLVVVALSPIVGLAFLFGGVSPWHVVFGFLGLGLVLGVAVAYGVALSARLRSTRAAVLLALATFPPASFIATTIVTLFGELAGRSWGTTMDGPFWFTDALASRLFELDTFLLVAVLPLYLGGMLVWFLLASAVAGVRPAAEDRSTIFKWWTVAAVGGLVAILFGVTTLVDRSDVGEASVTFVMLTSTPLLFLALLFMNEPPLPPRFVPAPRRAGPLARRLRVLFGPGAAPTTRFAAVAIVTAAVGSLGATMGARYLVYPGHADHLSIDVALATAAAGNAAVALFALAFGAYARVALRSGVAARVLTAALLFVLTTLPILISLVVDPDRMNDLDERLPLPVLVSPIAHFILAGGVVADRSVGRALVVVVPVVVYGGLAFFFWALLEARVRKARATLEAQRAARERRAEEAAAARESRSAADPATSADAAPSADLS